MILNIIANLLLQRKTILVVSNNNSATGNIYEELAKDKFDFLCARLGKRENVDLFLESQSEDYPEELKAWLENEEIADDRLRKDLSDLEAHFSVEEKLVSTRMALSSVRSEYEHFKMNVRNDAYDCRKAGRISSGRLMTLHEKLRMRYADKTRLSRFAKFSAKMRFGIRGVKPKNINEERLLATIRFAYYENKISELDKAVKRYEELFKRMDPFAVYASHKRFFQKRIAERFCLRKKREIFGDAKGMKSLTAEYPVVLSTTFSSVKALGWGSGSCLYDYVIMDESSQVDVITGILALSCAKNAR